MPILEELIAGLVALLLQDFAIPVAEDAISGKIAPPPATVQEGYYDADVIEQVRDAENAR